MYVALEVVVQKQQKEERNRYTFPPHRFSWTAFEADPELFPVAVATAEAEGSLNSPMISMALDSASLKSVTT